MISINLYETEIINHALDPVLSCNSVQCTTVSLKQNSVRSNSRTNNLQMLSFCTTLCIWCEWQIYVAKREKNNGERDKRRNLQNKSAAEKDTPSSVWVRWNHTNVYLAMCYICWVFQFLSPRLCLIYFRSPQFRSQCSLCFRSNVILLDTNVPVRFRFDGHMYAWARVPNIHLYVYWCGCIVPCL